MTRTLATDLLFGFFAAGSLVTALAVFRTRSVVRAAFWLLTSFVAVGAIVIMLGMTFIGAALILLMTGEMLILAVIAVMFRDDPGGLAPAPRTHQHRAAAALATTVFLGIAIVAVTTEFPDRPADPSADHTAALGLELLGGSMLAFQTAAVVLLATMIGAIVVASRHGRYGDADEGSIEPELDPERPSTGGAP